MIAPNTSSPTIAEIDQLLYTTAAMAGLTRKLTD
jgi:hypothetical protein